MLRLKFSLLLIIFLLMVAAGVFCLYPRESPSPFATPPLYPEFKEGVDRGPKFIIFGDSRTKNPLEIWRATGDRARLQIIEAIKEETPAFVLNLGDLVLYGSNASHWALFDEENAPLREGDIPYLPVIGNHDCKGELSAALNNIFVRFHFLKNRRWYSFRYRNAGFIVLDSNYSALTAREKYDQYRFIEEEVERFNRDKEVRFIFPCFHHPPYTNVIAHKGYPEMREDFLPRLLSTPKVCAIFTAHVHTYEHFKIQGCHFINSGGGGAPSHKIYRGKMARYPDVHKGFKGFHYCSILLKDGSFQVTVHMIGPKGKWMLAETFELPESGS